ncbi:MAG: OmpA family protein [Dysgonamonadaceae bacterium]|jgi:peptidoglycan-associated lipoprotein|nr:OmpA family protein [Dysgonamonadaceae bacterium]
MNRYPFFAILLFLSLSSCETANLSDAVAKEERGEYYAAARTYRSVYAKTSAQKTHLRGSIAFHMAECYRKIENTQKALSGYNNAIRYDYEDSSKVFYSALMLHKLGRYADAKEQYAAFLDSFPNHRLARNGITGCDSALKWKANPTRYIVKKMDKISSRYGEFAPVLSGDKYDRLIFTSSRKDAVGDSKSAITGIKNNDFYEITLDEKGQWTKPKHIENAINTEYDEGVCSFSANGATMYYTCCPEEDGTPKTADVYKSSRSGAQWNAGERVAIFKDSTSMAAHPAVGADGYLYFVSDVKGGYGGKDIWRIPIGEIGSVAPENLGPDINTPGDEMFPCMREDSILYFSSDGHPGMGGLDVFKAVERKGGKWRVENMKSPINSMSDDFGICFEGTKEKGYFSSNRNDAQNADHIYSFELPDIHPKIEGWVLDRDENLIDGAVVRMVGKDGSDRRIDVRKDGTYTADVVLGMDYVLMGSAPGFLNQKQSLSVPNEEKNQTFYVDFYLASISKPLLIENIFYDFDRATLRPESEDALIQLIIMLEDNPNITVELSAHTDRKGTDEYNNNLSLQRAQSVIDYLIAGGIEKERLTPAGYGKSAPKTVTKNLAKEYGFLLEGQVLDAAFIETLEPDRQEIADQINRRTEFKILRTNYRLF